MPELDREIVDRALRWCAESGRPVREEVARHVLAPLGWDELLAVKAVLADPPPSRNLSPADLVALSRGAPPPAAETAAPPPRARTPRGARVARPPAGPRIRRARDRVDVPPPAPPSLPPIDLLFRESGRGVLERIVRRKGAARPAILAELAAGWSAGAGTPGPADLERLLDHHGLVRAFAERERALLLHAFRKHGGVGARVARELGFSPEELAAALARLGLERPVEAIRDARRRTLERKATISERARLVDEEAEALADLGLLPRLEEDLRRRLPEQIRALGVGGRPPSSADLGRSLSLGRAAVDRLVARFGLSLRPAPPDRWEGRPPGRSPSRGAPRSPSRGAPRSTSRSPAGGSPRGPSRNSSRGPARRGPRP